MIPIPETALRPPPHIEEWLSERTLYASRELHDCVEFNPDKLGGVPVLKGTRMSLAQILAELAEGRSTAEVADDFELDAALVKRFVSGLAVGLDRPNGAG